MRTHTTHQYRTLRRFGLAALLALTAGLAACGDDDADDIDMDDVDVTTPGSVDATMLVGDLPDDSTTDSSMSDSTMSDSTTSGMTTIAP